MVELRGKTFYDRASGTRFENLSILDCTFDGCFIPRPADGVSWTLIRNVSLDSATNINCSIDRSIFEDVSLNGLKKLGRSPLLLWGCLFRRVTLSGKISGVKINRSIRPNATNAEQDAWDQNARLFYSQTDWALDISRARFGGSISFEAIPGSKIRTDPSTQVLVTREALLSIKWRELDFMDTSYHISLGWFEQSIFESVVLAASLGSKNHKQELVVLDSLRNAGLAR